jgi:hypothetical protein
MSYAFPLRIDWHCVCGDAASSHVSRAETEECHGHCQRTAQDCAGRGYRPIDHAGRTPAISAIFDMAGRLRIPTHYTCDLSTDYQMLTTYTGSFIWVVREMGTHLYPLEPETSMSRDWQRDYVRSSLSYHEANRSDGQRVYYWSAAKAELAEVDYDTAKAIAAVYTAPLHPGSEMVESIERDQRASALASPPERDYDYEQRLRIAQDFQS